jgi:hypothetical protein
LKFWLPPLVFSGSSVQQAFFINIINIHKINSQLPQAFGCKLPVCPFMKLDLLLPFFLLVLLIILTIMRRMISI